MTFRRTEIRSASVPGQRPPPSAHQGRTGSLRLPDGRKLAFAQWGALDGRPVVHFHGVPGSRLERYVDEGLTASLGVRFITVDRPGYGLSSPAASPSLLGFAEDVGALADHLGLRSFQVHAWSGGAPYALATARHLGCRVSHATILAGVGPLDRPNAFDGMTPGNVEEYSIARLSPERLPSLLTKHRLRPSLPEFELAAYNRSDGLLDMMLENDAETRRQGFAGRIADDLAIVGNWGFQLETIEKPLHLWHGDCDELVPCHHAQYVADHAPQATLRLCRGEGHLDMLSHQQEVFAILPS